MAEPIDRLMAASGLLLAAGLAWWGASGPLDRFLFDAIARASLPKAAGSPGVVVVGMAPAAGEEAWRAAIEEVGRAGAAVVGVVAEEEGDGFEGVIVPCDLVVAVRAREDSGDRAAGMAVASIQSTVDGVQRWWEPTWRGRPTLPARVADVLGRPAPADDRLCLFRRPRGSLAVLASGHVTGRLGAPRSVIEGNVVLVGVVDSAESRVTTFLHRGEEALPPLLFHAAVVECVLGGGLIDPVPAGWAWVLALTTAAAAALLGHGRPRVPALAIGAAAVAAVSVAAWAGLHLGEFWMPPGGVLLGSVVAAVWVGGSRARRHRVGVEGVLRRMSLETEERAEGRGFLVEEAPWARVRAAWLAAFGHIRAAILRVDGEGGRLAPAGEADGRVVEAFFGGRIPAPSDELLEQARATRGVVQVGPGRWAVALAGAEQVHAYYLFEAPVAGLPRERLAAFAGHLGGLLDKRIRWRARARSSDRGVSTPGRFRPLHDRLAGAIDLLDGHRRLLADAMEAEREATVVIDVFGELLFANSAAFALCGDLDVELGQTAPAELLASLSGRPHVECRRHWRDALLGDEVAPILARPELRAGRRFLVRLAPLAHGALRQTSAVVLHLDDVTGLARSVLLKDDFIERIYYQLNNDFESIVGAASMIDDRRIGGDDRAALVGAIRHKAAEASAMLQRTRGHFRREFTLDPPGAYPVRIDPVLEAAAALVSGMAAARGIVVEREEHPYAQLVLACPRRLEALAAAILRVLERDARDGTRIRIAAHQNRGGLAVLFANEGFGLPPDRLRACLADPPSDDEAMQRLARARRHLASWGGSLTADAVVDGGLRFQVRLRCVV